jgi:hypothetical protein
MLLALDPQLSAADIRSILTETALWPESGGELNLIGALEKVLETIQAQGRYSFLQRWISKQQRPHIVRKSNRNCALPESSIKKKNTTRGKTRRRRNRLISIKA